MEAKRHANIDQQGPGTLRPVVWVLVAGALGTLSLPLTPAHATSAVPATQMVSIPSGILKPLFKERQPDRTIVAKPVPVATFELDTHAVTQRDYSAFVRANPQWRKSKAARVFADSNYLKNWKTDVQVGDPKLGNSPVTFVSWFAAKAYCEWVGKELPTVNEWEFAAAVPENDPAAQAAYQQTLLEWYGKPTPDRLPSVRSTFRNRFGVYDLHGLIWEWTADFNSALVQQDARGGSGEADSKQFCGGGSENAADFNDYAGFMRYAFRNSLQGNYTVANLGFRCARHAAEGKLK